MCHLSYYTWSPNVMYAHIWTKLLCYRLGEWVYQYLPFHQLVPVYYEAWDSFSWNTVLDSPFKVLTFYYTEHLFQHIVLRCPPLFCGIMLKFWYFSTCSANLLFEQYIPLLVRNCLLLFIDSFNQGFNMTVYPCLDPCFNYIGAGVLAAGLCPISRRSSIELRLRMCLRCCFWVASKSVRLSVSGLL
jgi:hypothetical protein